MISVFSGSCEAAGQEADAGDQAPGMGAGDGRLEVFGEAAVTIEPGKGAFDGPAAWQDLETDGAGHATDDLDRPFAEFSELIAELIASIGALAKRSRSPSKNARKDGSKSQTSCGGEVVINRLRNYPTRRSGCRARSDE